MQKLFCYVDESGQDTEGKLFLVSVVIVGKERDELRKKLREIEKKTNKKARKWMKSRPQRREDYIQEVANLSELKGCIYYSTYKDSRTYVDLTILSTAKAFHDKSKGKYQATIFVDGLERSERYRFSAGLRKLDVSVHKVRGIKREQSDEFIRLADALCGFVRDSIEGNTKFRKLLESSKRKGLIKEL